MIECIYDKTSKISFSTYGDDFLRYFGEYIRIIEELGTEVHTLYGTHRRLDKLVLVDDGILQNWEFEYHKLTQSTLSKIWDYNKLKSSETGKIMDSFIICFGNSASSEEEIKIGRTVTFAPIIKYLQKMGLPKQFSTIEDKVKDNRRITVLDELTLIFVTLSVKDSEKEKIVKRVCCILDEIDYIDKSRREVIDSLISFQIENFVKSEKDKNKLNKVVDMQLSVEELFLQVEREYEFDKGYDQGRQEVKDEVILNMLNQSVDDAIIQNYTGCSLEHLQNLKREHLAGK